MRPSKAQATPLPVAVQGALRGHAPRDAGAEVDLTWNRRAGGLARKKSGRSHPLQLGPAAGKRRCFDRQLLILDQLVLGSCVAG